MQAFSLFFRGCCNSIKHLTYMEEINVSNTMTILLKLPYKFRDRSGGIGHVSYGSSMDIKTDFQTDLIERL